MPNQKLLDGLVKTLALEKFEENLFRGQSEKTSWGRVFGGQVIGQALSAASQTVESLRIAHSPSCVFFKTRKSRYADSL